MVQLGSVGISFAPTVANLPFLLGMGQPNPNCPPPALSSMPKTKRFLKRYRNAWDGIFCPGPVGRATIACQRRSRQLRARPVVLSGKEHRSLCRRNRETMMSSRRSSGEGSGVSGPGWLTLTAFFLLAVFAGGNAVAVRFSNFGLPPSGGRPSDSQPPPSSSGSSCW